LNTTAGLEKMKEKAFGISQALQEVRSFRTALGECPSMPIRFRCAYCNQLLGIARRKAGTVVRCPTCSGQVVVPTVKNGSDEKSPQAGDLPVFERSDFEDLLNDQAVVQPEEAGAGTPPQISGIPPAGAWGTNADPQLEIERLGVPGSKLPAQGQGSPPGILLTPAKATLFTVLGIISLAVAFGAGLLVGRFLL
jgi:phage FluMu protein Com